MTRPHFPWLISIEPLPGRPGDNDAARRVAMWLKDGLRVYRLSCRALAAESLINKTNGVAGGCPRCPSCPHVAARQMSQLEK